jgi:3-phosphoshikimate 1-carboxyvinyltransferase
MIASLINTDIKISGFLDGNDPISTANALNQIGAKIEISNTNVNVSTSAEAFKSIDDLIDLGNSGTGIRLLSGFISGLGLKAKLTGDESLIKRPMRRVAEPLTLMGADISTDSGTPPIQINPGSIKEDYVYEMPISSAQVKSAILLAALTAKKKVTVIEKKITRDHTERMIEYFGGDICVEEHEQGRKITLFPSELKSQPEYSVAGDFSSASFLIVAGLIAKNSKILIKNVGLNESRCGLIGVLKKMGAR